MPRSLKENRKIVCAFLQRFGVDNPWSLSDKQRLEKMAELTSFSQEKRIFYKSDLKHCGASYFSAAARIAISRRDSIIAFPQSKRTSKNPIKRHVIQSSFAPTQAMIDNFYASWEWKRLSYDTKLKFGAKMHDVRKNSRRWNRHPY